MKHLLYTLLSGILLAMAWPTYGFPFLLFIAFVPLLLVIHQLKQTKNKVGLKIALYSALAFFIWNIVASYWLYFSTPFGMWFSVCFNTTLMTLVVYLSYRISKKRLNFFQSYLLLMLLWIGFEYLHLNWEFSWPWLNIGNAFSEYTQVIQWYEYTGTFGGTLWVWIVNLIAFTSIVNYNTQKHKLVIRRSLISLIACIAIPIGISLLILKTYTSSKEDIEVVILQPNIDPYNEKYNTTDASVSSLLKQLTYTKATRSTDLILAPETVFADNTRLGRYRFSHAKAFADSVLIKYPKTSILSGISMYSFFRDASKITSQSNSHKSGGWYNSYNSAFFENATTTSTFYHKSKLVAGVESLPYASVFTPILGGLMLDMGGTVSMKTTQKNRDVFTLTNGIKTAPIICYESVYGEFVTGYVRNGAQNLSIITNDAWWSNSQGHKQHFSYSRLRAIETRRSISRSANTGISGFISETGSIINAFGYNKQGALVGRVSVNNNITFYVKYGDYIARIALFILVLLILFALTKRRQEV